MCECVNWSTFHYGSIKIEHVPLKAPLFTSSTFHYGSIKIYRIWRIEGVYFNLHSTMVLLK